MPDPGRQLRNHEKQSFLLVSISRRGKIRRASELSPGWIIGEMSGDVMMVHAKMINFKMKNGWWRAFICAAGLSGCLVVAPGIGRAQVNVLTYHNDNARTGQNLNETVLALTNVNATQFGRLFSLAVDGYVYAQPLYVSNVSIPSNGVHHVVYVATEHDSVYAFDADAAAPPLWKTSFLSKKPSVKSVASTKAHCGDLVPEIGITGTPVIDPITGTLYVVGNTEEGTNFIQRLHALDITTGREKFGGPVIITASVAGTGDGSVGGAIAFNPLLGNQRPGLLLLNGVVYIAWASHCDLGLYHGWILGYGATNLQQVAVFNATPNGQQGGIWMSGDGLSADTNGIIYGATGNGTFDANLGGIDFGDSVLKLSSTGGLAVVDYFAPFNQQMLADEDLDLGSGGVLVVPTQSATVSNLLVACGKQGTVYVLNRDNLGHFQSGSDSQIVQSLTNLLKASFDTPAYWNGRVYYAGVNNPVEAFAMTNGLLSSSPVSVSAVAFGFPGATPSISANGATNGIVWVIQRIGKAILRAYDANNLTNELYSSSTRHGDSPGKAVKFAVPTVANGKVYVGVQRSLAVYGLRPD